MKIVLNQWFWGWGLILDQFRGEWSTREQGIEVWISLWKLIGAKNQFWSLFHWCIRNLQNLVSAFFAQARSIRLSEAFDFGRWGLKVRRRLGEPFSPGRNEVISLGRRDFAWARLRFFIKFHFMTKNKNFTRYFLLFPVRI